MPARITFLAVIGLLGVVAAAAASEAPPSAYASLTTSGAAACARACADDGICMAWSFHRENQCQLSAVVPRTRDADALASGFAARAPAFLQPIQREAPIAPAQVALAPTAPSIEPEPDELLLGGPQDGDLRLSLR